MDKTGGKTVSIYIFLWKENRVLKRLDENKIEIFEKGCKWHG